MYSPVVVRLTFLPLRSNKGMPTCDSSSLICMVTAGGVRCKFSAARTKLNWRATSLKTRSCRKVAFFMAAAFD